VRKKAASTHPESDVNTQPTKKTCLGILTCGHAPVELGDSVADYPDLFVQMLGADAFDYRFFDIVGGDPIPEPGACDAWLITGSRHGVYEDHPWIAPLEALVRRIHEEGRPLVGICFGHQLVAQALGGRVEKHAGGWSVGRVEYRLDDAADAVPLMAYHQDQVIEPPPGARVLGESDVCRYAALAIGDTIRTLQPHPEFDVSVVTGLLDTRGKAIPPERLAAARASLEDAADVEHARATVADGFRAFLRGEVAAAEPAA